MTAAQDVLLVEDIATTVEGLELDLRARGGSVFLVPDAVTAERNIREDPWALALFDLRIPQAQGEEALLRVGTDLIRSMVSGALGDLNRTTPFAIISQETTVPEADEFQNLQNFIGFYSKNEDSRRLFRVLRERGLLKDHEFDDDYAPEVRRRTKFLVTEVHAQRGEAVLLAPVVDDEAFVVRLDKFRPSVRERLLRGGLPVWVYGTANVAAKSAAMLLPEQLDETFEPVTPRRLDIRDIL